MEINMQNINYISLEQAIDIHKKTVRYSGGGIYGAFDTGRLESVLEHIKMMIIIRILLIN